MAVLQASELHVCLQGRCPDRLRWVEGRWDSAAQERPVAEVPQQQQPLLLAWRPVAAAALAEHLIPT